MRRTPRGRGADSGGTTWTPRTRSGLSRTLWTQLGYSSDSGDTFRHDSDTAWTRCGQWRHDMDAADAGWTLTDLIWTKWTKIMALCPFLSEYETNGHHVDIGFIQNLSIPCPCHFTHVQISSVRCPTLSNSLRPKRVRILSEIPPGEQLGHMTLKWTTQP